MVEQDKSINIHFLDTIYYCKLATTANDDIAIVDDINYQLMAFSSTYHQFMQMVSLPQEIND